MKRACNTEGNAFRTERKGPGFSADSEAVDTVYLLLLRLVQNVRVNLLCRQLNY